MRHEVNEFVARRLGRARRARPPGGDRGAVGVARARCASRGARSPQRGEPPGVAVRRRRRGAAAADGVPVLALGSGHPAAARAAPAGGAAAARRQPRARGAARRRRPRPRPRPRPVRAQRRLGGAAPLALAQRRQLPRAQRADALDPGRAAAGRDLPRPARRADDELRGDRGADGALLPRPLRAGRARAPTTRSSPGGRPRRARRARRPPRIAFCLDEERGALRLFLRAIRRLRARPTTGRRRSGRRTPTEVRVSQQLRERVRVVGPRETLARGADRRRRRARRRLRRARASRPTSSARRSPRRRSRSARSMPLYNELTRDGELGPAVPARRRDHPRGPARAPARERRRCAASSLRKARGAVRDWGAVADQVEEIYERIAARRHDPRGNPEVRRRIARRREIHVDLHMHTDHSSDCATPVETLLATAREAGLGAIAITDHNEISGAFAAARDRRRVRGQGDRRRGGEDRRAGRGDRPLPAARRSSAG